MPANKGKHHIVITEIPYQVNKANLIKDIANLAKDGVIEGITKVDDFSSLKDGMKIVVELKSDAVPDVVLNRLYKHTCPAKALLASSCWRWLTASRVS